MTDVFMFLRTKQGTDDVFDKLDRFATLFNECNGYCPCVLLFGEDELTWDDGFVLRFDDYYELTEICAPLFHALNDFAAWTIFRPHPDIRDFIEEPQPGPLSEFNWLAKDKALTIMFLMSKDGEEYKLSRYVDDIKRSLKHAVVYQVFTFFGGAVLVFSSTEPRNIAINRCSRTLSCFLHWAIVDPDGETTSDFRITPVWRDTLLPDDDSDNDEND
jgi:hypothetical protein